MVLGYETQFTTENSGDDSPVTSAKFFNRQFNKNTLFVEPKGRFLSAICW